MQVVARPRQAGKTTDLVHWVLDGHELYGWPGWSRVLLVSSPELVGWITQRFTTEDQALKADFPPGLPAVVLTHNQWYRQARGRNRAGLEIAVDDADHLIFAALGAVPTVIALTGSPAEL
jgi:hypothetical protein